jgi:membrane-bound ClpP family serine protease
MAFYAHRDEVDTPHQRTTAVARTHHFSPGQLLTGAVGAVLVIFGVIALVRSGVDGSLNTPPSDILGLTHSAYVGFAELALGLLLLIGSANVAYRGVAGAVGALMVIGGIIVAAGTNKMLLQIGTERATGWFFVVMGAIAILGSMLPSLYRSDRTVSTERV